MIELVLSLNALDHSRCADCTSQCDDGRHDCRLNGVSIDTVDKAAVYLDNVNRKARQVSEGRIPRSEVVYCHTNPERSHFEEGLRRPLHVVHGKTFSYLEDRVGAGPLPFAQ